MVFCVGHQPTQMPLQLRLNNGLLYSGRVTEAFNGQGSWLCCSGESGPPPDILLLHLGVNNLGMDKGKALVLQALDDTETTRAKWPGVPMV